MANQSKNGAGFSVFSHKLVRIGILVQGLLNRDSHNKIGSKLAIATWPRISVQNPPIGNLGNMELLCETSAVFFNRCR